jgi:hypothetical protein
VHGCGEKQANTSLPRGAIHAEKNIKMGFFKKSATAQDFSLKNDVYKQVPALATGRCFHEILE